MDKNYRFHAKGRINMNIVYGVIATIVCLGLLLAVFMIAYNIYMNFKEQREFDIEYRKNQERKGK
jgi:hypothetical protein